jgi:hypothetical protein
MNNEINTNSLVNSLKYLKAYNLSPISVKTLQEIIHHGLEDFDDLQNTKLKFIIENPEDKNQKRIFQITEICFVAELKMLSLQNNRKIKKCMTLFDLQQVINDLKSKFQEWGEIIVNIENIMIPSNYYFTESNEVFFKIKNVFEDKE